MALRSARYSNASRIGGFLGDHLREGSIYLLLADLGHAMFLDLLQGLHFPRAQGFYLAKPMPFAEMNRLARSARLWNVG